MIRTLGLAVIVSALSGSLAFAAQAPRITVNIAGKSPQEVHADLVKAASDVCNESPTDGLLDPYDSDRFDCVHDTLKQAMLTVKKMQADDNTFAQNMAGRSPRQ